MLVISNNFLSDSLNNGKTLKYLLSNYKEKELFWVYSTPLALDLDSKISRVLVSPFVTKLTVSINKSDFEKTTTVIKKAKNLRSYFKRFIKAVPHSSLLYNFLRLSRDLIYLSRYAFYYNFILSECKKNDIEKILLVAGDFVFFHKLARGLSSFLNVPLHVFVTDDYVLKYKPGKKYAFRKGVFNTLLVKNFEKTFSLSKINYFISDKMRSVYHKVFDIDGYVSFNATDFKYLGEAVKEIKGKSVIRYFGSLHSGRDSALVKLLRIAMLFNQENENQLFFEIYTGQSTTIEIFKEFPPQLITFMDTLTGVRYQEALIEADALILLESDKVYDLQTTWLSFSTKVLEYLNSKNNIIAFGPMENPSIHELVANDAAIYIDSYEKFSLLFSLEACKRISHNSDNLREKLLNKNKLF